MAEWKKISAQSEAVPKRPKGHIQRLADDLALTDSPTWTKTSRVEFGMIPGGANVSSAKWR